jgi:hypothetical protein
MASEGLSMRMFKSSIDFIYRAFSEHSLFLLPNNDEVGVKLEHSPDKKGENFPASAVGWEVLFVMR